MRREIGQARRGIGRRRRWGEESGGGKCGAGLGAAEGQDEAIHFLEELADFPELGAEGEGGVFVLHGVDGLLV